MNAEFFLPLTSRLLLQTVVLHGQPVITSQPVDRSVSLGVLLTNEVIASGTLPLTFQWHFNQTPFPSATNRTLILTNLTLAKRARSEG